MKRELELLTGRDEIEPPIDQVREFYRQDVTEWRALDRKNEERWQRMSRDQKQRVADLYKPGKGLYTIESCIAGFPEWVFEQSCKKKVDS